MRKLLLLVLLVLLVIACKTAVPPAAAPPKADATYGMTVEEEAQILAMEDQRAFDPAVVDAWTKHPNPLHRQRMALALGRIGPHVFIDANNDGLYDPETEKRAGVDALTAMIGDSDRRVRETVAFSLGEIGDRNAAGTLFYLTTDADAAVAAEAVEALSKLAAEKKFSAVDLPRYYDITTDKWPEGIRARAVRFLFRFDSDEASAAAMKALEATSDAVRQEGTYALARRAYAPARDALHLLINDRNTLTRAYAATALGRIGAADSIPFLVTALGDAHPWVRTNAAVALGRVADKKNPLRADDLPRVFAVAEDPDPGTRVSIIDVIGHYAESNETARARLLEILRNGSQWERELAAGAIAKHFAPDSETFRQLGELSPWQKVRVIEATAAMPHGAAIRAQYAAAAEPLVRAAVLGAIPDEGADAEIELIRKGLADPDVIVRANAIDRFAVTKPADIREWIKTLLTLEMNERKSPANDARLIAISSIARVDDPQRKVYLRRLLSDPDPMVRRTTAEIFRDKEGGKLPQYTPYPTQRTPAEYAEIALWSRQPHSAAIHMTRGVIEMVLLTQDAPLTTWNFAQLAKRKYFDNSSFMRVVPNFVIQGGDPRNDMSGGPGYSIRDEINLQKYTRGAVGMALSGPDTGGSQFFITHSPQPHLDGGYTIFGRVYEGMNGVVDQTERGDRVETITIDEKPAPGDTSVSNVSLPLEIGVVTPDRLLARVPGYEQRKSEYKPDLSVVEMMKSYFKPGDRVEVYMGTWCSDSQREVPKFLRILDELRSQFGIELPATFVAVDRSKQKPADLIAGKDLQKVATFIYYRGDRELGRIVERPSSVFEDDLLAIAAKE